MEKATKSTIKAIDAAVSSDKKLQKFAKNIVKNVSTHSD